jgi:hypothetical protein
MLVISIGVLSFGSIGSAASTSLVINEVDYDQPGTDASEFLELKNVSGAAIDLDPYTVELINGSNATLYGSFDLPAVSLAAGDYFVICANAATVSNCDLDVAPDENLIQNGAPDGIRLLLAGVAVDAVSYEGDTTGATEGSGTGLVDTAAAADESISRCPDGADSDINNADFSLRAISPGAANDCAGPKLVINEVDYDQPGTDGAEFLELKNTSTAAADLDPYVLEFVNGSSGAVYSPVDLPAVSLAGGDYFVICANAATTANCDLDVSPDSNLIQNGAPDGLRLMLAGAAVDAVSYEGDTAGATEGSGGGLEDVGEQGLSRCPDGEDTDVNNADFSLRDITPGAENACAVASTLVINEVDYDQPGSDAAEYLELKNTGTAGVNLDPYVVELTNGATAGAVYGTFDLPAVSLAGGDYFVICANAATVSNCDLDVDPNTDRIQNGSPDGIRLLLAGAPVDSLSYEGNTAGSTEGTGTSAADSNSEANVGLSRCPDGADTNDNDADFVLAPITPGATNICGPPPPDPVGNCGEPATRIHAVQGNGTATPIGGTAVTIEGVVTGDYQGAEPEQFNGYFVQEEVADQDADTQTSEGIFVFSGSGVDNVSAGDVVRVRGTAGEFFQRTQLSSVTGIAVCSSGASVPATQVSLPVGDIGDHERHEGMLVQYTQTLTATEVFNLGRFGEVSLSGVGRLYNPTAVAQPGAPAQAVGEQNDRSRIVLDDGVNDQNIDPTLYPQGGLSATNTLRVGDTLPGITGVLDFAFGAYRLQPVEPVEFTATNPRPPAHDAVGGNLEVASFNVLNYFNGDGMGGGFPTSRGADTALELERQEAKIVSAITAIDADVVGLMEIENDGGPNGALAQLVAALNEATAPGTYAGIDTGVIGTDEIAVALIYKPAAATPIGDWEILTSADDPRFDDTKSRPALAQTFRHTGSGQKLTVVVNHLKSKGSGCGAGDDQPDEGGGNCNGTRTLAAAALADWLATDPTGSGDADFMIIGDLNAYTFETPISTLEDAGYTNLIRAFNGLDAYSYVFMGESGYLDHALATSSLAAQVTGTTIWHINPDEPTVLDYNMEFKSDNHDQTLYDAGPYRASDHDPVIVGVQLDATYASLCELTRAAVSKEGVANALCAKLAEAEAADERGDDDAKAGSLGAYVNQLEAQSGKSLTAEAAAQLAAIAATL